MENLDSIASHIRGGGILLAVNKTGTWLLGSTRHPQNFEKVAKEAKIPYEGGFILIGSMDHLYEYVLRFSDLAWDIAQESEKALLIWYDNAKDLPKELKDAQGNIGIMLNRCNTLQPLLNKMGHGLLCLMLPVMQEGWQALPNVLPLSLDNSCKLVPERIMRLGTDGDVKFLKY